MIAILVCKNIAKLLFIKAVNITLAIMRKLVILFIKNI